MKDNHEKESGVKIKEDSFIDEAWKNLTRETDRQTDRQTENE